MKWLGVLLLTQLSSLSAAVYQSQQARGDVAIVPFFSVLNQSETHLRLQNSSGSYKAIKLVIRETLKGDSLWALNLYLNPHSESRLHLKQSSGFLPIEINTDATTCVMGLDSPNETAFNYTEDNWSNGFIELFDMGQIDAIDLNLTNQEDLLDCSKINAAWLNNGLWSQSPDQGLTAASGDLSVISEIHHPSKAMIMPVPVTYFLGFYEDQTIHHHPPGMAYPDLNSGSKESLIINEGEIIQTTWEHGFEAVSAVITGQQFEFDFNSLLVLSYPQHMNWAVTFPTLRFYLNELSSPTPFIASETHSGAVLFPDYLTSSMNFYNNEGGSLWRPLCIPLLPCSGQMDHDTDIVKHSVNIYSLDFYAPDAISNKPLFNEINQDNYFSLPMNNFSLSGDGYKFILRPADNYRAGYDFARVNTRGLSSETNSPQSYYGLPLIGFSWHFSDYFQQYSRNPAYLLTSTPFERIRYIQH